MSGKGRRASEIAREHRADLLRLAANPSVDPSEATLLELRAGMLEDGLRIVEAVEAERAKHRAAARQAYIELVATIKAYRRWQSRPGNLDRRPTQVEIADERRMGERTLALKLRDAGIEDWHDVHALVEATASG
jgi:hypothetical protein